MASGPPPSTGGALRAFLAFVALAAWGAFLLTPAFAARGPGAVSLWDLRSLDAARGSLLRLATDLALAALCFAPLGVTAVYVFADRASRLVRALLVGLPAFLLGTAAAAAVVALRARPASLPGVSELIVPAAGVWLGVLAGLSLRRGLFSLLFLPLRLAIGAALLAVVAVVLLYLSLEPEPLVPEPHRVTTDVKRRIVAAFRGKDPRTIEPGGTRTLRLAQEDADGLVAWATPLVVNPGRLRGAVRFDAADAAGVRVSARLPVIGRWLNAEATARVRVDDGRLWLREPRLRFGPWSLPPVLLDPLAPALQAAVQSERPLRPVLRAIRQARIEPGAAFATYGRVELPRGLVASLVWGEATSEGLRDAVAEQVAGVLAAVRAAPAGDARLARAYESAFRRAQARSQGGSAVEENRAALLGLGVVLGTPHLTTFAGDVADAGQRQLAAQLRSGTTAHGRADWTRHFAVSGGLTVLSAVAPSDAAGLLKEELDADGGSGFSFGDLLADRSGTAFAELATRNEETAAAVQRRVAAGFRLDDFFPPGRDLPENIPDSVLRAQYGGVGGPLYRRYADEIERRIASAAGYR
jgi:hypothetical protein